MRVFKTRVFERFARKAGIDDAALLGAIRLAESGLVDADLGGGVVKLRVARRGAGKSGGFRTIVAFRRGAMAFFVYGFAKSARPNIDDEELRAFRRLADDLLGLDGDAIGRALAAGAIIGVGADEQAL